MLCGLISWAFVLVLGYLAVSLLNKRRKRLMLERWTETSLKNKDVVILHGLPRARTVPSGSPFVLKLETYLKLAKIPYTYDTTDRFGVNGKCPWISINGVHCSDSQLIIEFLGKKFGKNLNGNYSKEQLAISTAVRVMTEEHLFWGCALWLFVWGGRQNITSILKLPKLIVPYISYTIKQATWSHGIGRHSEEDIHKLMKKDLETISTILGNKKYLLGDEPCEDDCAIFGLMAQFIWAGGIGSPESKLILGEYKNITEYCERMKARVWPDWDEFLSK